MSTLKNMQISYLLDASIKKNGADFTKVLGTLGNGSMGQGLWELWIDGQRNGLVTGVSATTATFVIGFSTYALIKNAILNHQMQKFLTGFPVENHSSDTQPYSAHCVDSTERPSSAQSTYIDEI